MHIRAHYSRRSLGVLFALAFALMPSFAYAEVDKQDVTFRTVDEVELKGVFYPGQGEMSGRKSPCVMLLHKYGSDRTKGNYDALAATLQAKGFSVLSFDFRGHGRSKELRSQSTFWNTTMFPYNGAAGGRLGQTRIDVKSFRPAYYPWLINDLIAARRFLEEKNDAGELNVGQLFVIAERDAGNLALMWLACEHARPRVARTMANPNPRDTAGSDVAGLVFLSTDKDPPGKSISYNLTGTARQLWYGRESVGETIRERQSMCFLVGAQDQTAVRSANWFYNDFLAADKVDKKDQIAYLVPIKNTKLGGVELLGPKGLGTEEAILNYLAEILKRGRGNPTWIEREVNKIPFDAVSLPYLGYR